MFTKSYKKKDIPKGSYVVRVSDTKDYIHICDDVGLFVKPKMMGCLIFLSKEKANEIVEMLRRIESEMFDFAYEVNDYEVVPFEEAYNTHGLIERQVVYN